MKNFGSSVTTFYIDIPENDCLQKLWNSLSVLIPNQIKNQ